MSHTESVLVRAHRSAAPAMGYLSLTIAARRGATPAKLAWVARCLRRAADEIEELTR